MSTRTESPRQAPVRDRAQLGSFAGALFAALVGADPFDIRSRSHEVQYVDYFAIALWVVAVFLFLHAGVTSEQNTGEGRLRLAVRVAGLATALTTLALLFTAFGFSLDRDRVTLSLTPKEVAALRDLCGADTASKPRGTI